MERSKSNVVDEYNVICHRNKIWW